MIRERWVYLAIIAACAGLLYKCDARANEEIGALNLRAQQLATEKLALQAQASSLANRFRTETVTVRVTSERFRTLIDSFTRFDTVQLTRRETLIVERATQALGACQTALVTCMDLGRVKDSLLANREEALKVEIARRPTLMDKTRTAAVFMAVGFLLNSLVR